MKRWQIPLCPSPLSSDDARKHASQSQTSLLVSPHERCGNPWHSCQPHMQSNPPKWRWSPQTGRCRFSQWGTRTQAASGTLQSNTRSPEQPVQGKGMIRTRRRPARSLHEPRRVTMISPTTNPSQIDVQVPVCSQSLHFLDEGHKSHKIIFYVTSVVRVHFSERLTVVFFNRLLEIQQTPSMRGFSAEYFGKVSHIFCF